MCRTSIPAGRHAILGTVHIFPTWAWTSQFTLSHFDRSPFKAREVGQLQDCVRLLLVINRRRCCETDGSIPALNFSVRSRQLSITLTLHVVLVLLALVAALLVPAPAAVLGAGVAAAPGVAVPLPRTCCTGSLQRTKLAIGR